MQRALQRAVPSPLTPLMPPNRTPLAPSKRRSCATSTGEFDGSCTCCNETVSKDWGHRLCLGTCCICPCGLTVLKLTITVTSVLSNNDDHVEDLEVRLHKLDKLTLASCQGGITANIPL